MKKLKLKLDGEELTKGQMKKVIGATYCTPDCRTYSYEGPYALYGDCITMSQAQSQAEQYGANWCCDSCEANHGFPSCC